MRKVKVFLVSLVCCMFTCLSLIILVCINNVDSKPIQFENNEIVEDISSVTLVDKDKKEMVGSEQVRVFLIAKGIISKQSECVVLKEFGHELLILNVCDIRDMNCLVEGNKKNNSSDIGLPDGVNVIYNDSKVIFDITI